MANQNQNRIVAEVNRWAKYLSPFPQAFVPSPADTILGWYRILEYPGPGATPGLAPRRTVLGDGQPLKRPPLIDPNPAHRQFLENPVEQLNGMALDALSHHWTGTKYLGEGGFGQVGLWEYRHPDPNALPYIGTRQVVVKECMGGLLPVTVDNMLRREANSHLDLGEGGSPHIVNMLLDIKAAADILGADENLGPEWNGKLRRIYLEYCSLGSLIDLLERRYRLGVEFSELALWRIFDCLVDGASALEDCYELQVDLAMGTFNRAQQPDGWIPRVHFDLKPDNIFLADTRTLHADHPLCKIGDLGLMRKIPQPPMRDVISMNNYEILRIAGTEGYYAPEQFTDEWDFANHLQSEIAGAYGPPLNIWGIGCIMYQLAIMSEDAPDPSDPFNPGYDLNGAAPKGVTYGVHLSVSPYSSALKDTIQECLYAVPTLRPVTTELKRRITNNIEACVQAGAQPELWGDYLPAEPLPPTIPMPPEGLTQAEKRLRKQAEAFSRRLAREDKSRQPLTRKQRGTKVKRRCNHMRKNNKQCGNKFNTTRGGREMYCYLHKP